MTTIPDHYAALGIDPTADPEVITAAYRALAKKFHPDSGAAAGTADAARFDQIQQAYEVLRNPEARRAYDLELLEATERELAEHIAAKRRVALRERTGEGSGARSGGQAAPPPPEVDLGDIRPEPAVPPGGKPAPARARRKPSLAPFAIPLVLMVLLGGGAAWLFLPEGPKAPPLPGSAQQQAASAQPQQKSPAPEVAPETPPAPLDIPKVTPAKPAPQPQTASPAAVEKPVFGSTASDTAALEAQAIPAADEGKSDSQAAAAPAGADAAAGAATVAPAEAPADAAAAPPPVPKPKPAQPVKQAQKPAAARPVQKQAQPKPPAPPQQPRARLVYQDPPQYYEEGMPPPPPGMELPPPGYYPPGYEPGFRPPGGGPYRLVIWERQPGRPPTAWSAGMVFKSIGKCTRQGVKAVLRRTGGEPYGGTRVWYECQQLTQR